MDKDQTNVFSSLISFLNESESLINKLLKSPNEFLLKEFSADKDFLNLLTGAWEEVRGSIGSARQKLKTESPALERKLQKCGLSGIQLKLKIELFNRAMRSFYAKGSSIWLKRLLSIINAILASLASVLPMIEPVKEFKEALEQIIETQSTPPDNSRTEGRPRNIRAIIISKQ